MAKTILIAGYGPGVSTAVAEKFGSEGFQIGIVGRSADKLRPGCAAHVVAHQLRSAFLRLAPPSTAVDQT